MTRVWASVQGSVLAAVMGLFAQTAYGQDNTDLPFLRAHPAGIRTNAVSPTPLPDFKFLQDAPRQAPASKKASWWAPAASVVVPGSGQLMLRQQRGLAYVVAEAFMVIQASRVDKDYNNARSRYREIAANVARMQFGSDRPDGPWEYYEILADNSVTASGNYNLATTGKFTPETDETTYNGRQWLLARLLYWSSPTEAPADNSPEYQRALDFYQSRAWQGSFRWTWRDNQTAKLLYVQTINEANHTKQKRVSMVGLIAANHLLSLVDSYITVRMRRYGGAGLVSASISSELRPTGMPGENAVASALRVSVPIPGSGRRP